MGILARARPIGSGEGRVVRRAEVPSRGEVTVAVTTPATIKEVEVDPGKWLIQSNYKNDRLEIR